MIRKIVTTEVAQLVDGNAPAPSLLSKECKSVEVFDDQLTALVTDLMDTLFAHPICIGLAAPQIGRNARVAIVNLERKDRDSTIVLINPEVQSISGKKDDKRESCMSLPGVTGPVTRRTRLQVRLQRPDGKSYARGFEGFLARAVQHEIDHLDGRLYSSHMIDPVGGFAKTDIFDYDDPSGADGGEGELAE